MCLVSAALHVQRKEAWQQWHLHSQASSSHMAMPRNQHILRASACDMGLADASCKPRLAALQVPIYTLQVSLHALQFCIVPCIASQPDTYTA